jgi:hypothetical protein
MRLFAEFLNTPLRSREWMKADANFGGQTYMSPKDRRSTCGFNPDALGN